MERGNVSVFMTIAHVESLDDLGALMVELGERTELKLIGIVKEIGRGRVGKECVP